MWVRLLFAFLVASAMVDEALCNKNNKMTEILESLRRIEDHITKEDRLREIADVIRIDSNVDKLNIKMDQLLNMLDTRAGGTVGRFGSSDNGAVVMARGGDGGVEARLLGLESSLNNVEELVKKLDFESVKEIERRATQLKDDMNSKMRKMMNVLTALYELNKEMKSNAEEGRATPPERPSETPGGSSATEFLMENLEEMERKIKEQFSVLTSEIRSEVTSLKIVASTSCQSSSSNNDEEDESWMTPENIARSGQAGRSVTRGQSALSSLVETLGRSTREIRQDIQQGMQDIDTKLQNLTTMASKTSCSDRPLVSEESHQQYTSKRTVMPVAIRSEQEIEENSRRAKADIACTKSVQNVPNPKSCADLRKGGATCDGIYVIFIKGRRAVRVYCDMTTDGGGWTLLMRRGDYGDKMTSFHRNWLSYKNGFGDAEGEFWLGNDVTSTLTAAEPNALRIHLQSFDEDSIDLDYASFSVGNESTNFQLQLGPAVGQPSNAANSFLYHNNHPFSTFDRKNDNFEQNCAATYKGGWWFNGCYFGFLTGEYFGPEDKRENWEGMLWYDWKKNAALKGAQMMIRPKNFIASSSSS